MTASDYESEFAASLSEKAAYLSSLGRFSDALEPSVEACGIYLGMGGIEEPRGRAEAFTRHVIILARLDSTDEARSWACRALRAWELSLGQGRFRNRMLLVRIRHVVSVLQMLAGEDRAAADTVEEALEAVPGPRIGERGQSELKVLTRLLTTRAMALAGAGQPREAAEFAKEALRMPATHLEGAELPDGLARLADPGRGPRPSPQLLLTGLDATLAELAGLRSSGVAAGDSVRLHRRLAREQHDSARPSLLTALAARFMELSETGQGEEATDTLTEAISTARALLRDNDPGYGRHVTRVMDDIGAFLWGRLSEDDPSELDRVIDVLRIAHEGSAGADDAARAKTLFDLGSTLLTRFEWRQEGSDLDELIDLLRTAGELRAGSGLRRDIAWLASRALTYRYDMTRNQPDLDEAIEHGLKAIDGNIAAEGRDPDDSGGHQTGALSDLGAMLWRRYTVFGTREDLENAITLIDRSLRGLGAHHPQRAQQLVNLGTVLCARYEDTGDPATLDRAIEVTRAALPDDGARIPALNLLGTALLRRHEASASRRDLDEAVTILRQLLAEASEEDGTRGQHVAALAFALQQRYALTGDLACLDEALTAGREAVRLLRADDPRATQTLLQQSFALHTTFLHSGDQSLLDEAVDTAMWAASRMPVAHRDESVLLLNLVNALTIRAESQGTTTDLALAISLARRAKDLLPADSPSRSFALDLLERLLRLGLEHDTDHGMRGQALSLAVERGSPQTTLAEAIDVLRADTATPHALPLERIRAAERLGRLGMTAGQPDVALEGYGMAIDLLSLALAARHGLPTWRGGTEPGDLDELVNDAAAAAMAAGRPDLAVVLLERGRAALLAHSPGPDRMLERLQAVAPGLADQFRELGDRIAQADATGIQRAELAAEWDRLIERVRALPVMDSFLSPPTVQDLVAQAEAGPLVMVNVSRYRSDALIVMSDGITAVPLSDIHHQLPQQLQRFRSALAARYAPMENHLKAERPLRDVLHWLWWAVARPVLDSLGLREAIPGEPLPRLWWIPTGLLGLLPLHAAQDKELTEPPPAGSSPASVLDCVCPSYAATISALKAARATPHAPPSALVVAPTGSSRVSDLPHAQREAQEVQGRLRVAQLLTGAEATTAALLSQLPEASVLHVACHGVMNPGSLRTGGLELADGLLSTTELRYAQPIAPQLVFLSACRTAAYPAAEETPWQAVSLPAALHLGGYRHAVGTLWEADDRTHADISALFYDALGDSGSVDTDCSPRALHQAVLSMRARYPHIPSLWAAHIHVGP
ncbi:CHAT domain-containing protein [Streptomyces sp. FxanaA7]|uniref:CHAT domain-containing protein n=1 Tax=Streptomyces sp. FxanaA7 TaxID=1265492 RepID=UPI0005EDA716|nr:CHAT domain-containing protein [Streptomyces sp. FxanaA7]